ncbi:MAG: ATP-binding protein [Caldilineaceae bacterium]
MLQTPQLRWRTAFTYALVIFLVMTLLILFLDRQVSEIYTNNTLEHFATQASLTAENPELVKAWTQGAPALNALLHGWSTVLGGRVTAITASGAAFADSHLNPQQIENLSKLPEVRSALDGEPGRNARDEPELGGRAFFLAFPIQLPAGQSGVLRWAFPLSALDANLKQLRLTLFWSILFSALLIIALMVFQAERAAYTVRRLTELAERLARGDMNARILSLSSGEIGQLARAFNRMATRLQKQMSKRARERDRLNTVLYVMGDGVLILNKEGRVRMLNPAAAQILHVPEQREGRRTFVQVVRDHRIVEVWNRCLQSKHEESATVELESGRLLRVVVTPLFKKGNPTNGERGHLVIVQDLTRLHQLQTMRQDFVSNISHELRTPLASLRALVDTLNDGALDDPPAAQRFLRRMDVEVDALNQMVQELLELSRIESGKVPLVLRPTPVTQAIAPAAERLRMQAERAQLRLTIDLPSDLPPLIVDADRIQQVVTNLVHNAIKFTPSGGCVTITAQHNPTDANVTIKVQDNGVGIAAEDLPRIFERFYKADRARTGGGTGLGLAIAKHIVQAHGGRIWAESVLGKGSTFFFSLPTVNTTSG